MTQQFNPLQATGAPVISSRRTRARPSRADILAMQDRRRAARIATAMPTASPQIPMPVEPIRRAPEPQSSGFLDRLKGAGGDLLGGALNPLLPESVVRAALPEWGGIESAGMFARRFTSPLDVALTIATVGTLGGAAPVAVGARLGAMGAAKVAARSAFQPVVGGSVKKRLGAELGVMAAGEAGAQVGGDIGGTPGAIVGGLAGGVAGIGALRALPRTARTAAEKIDPVTLQPLGTKTPLSVARPSSASTILARADKSNLGIKAKVASEGRTSGPIKWIMDRVGGSSSTLQADDVVGRAIHVHMVQEDEAVDLITRNLNDFKIRLPGVFDIDAAGDIRNIGNPQGKTLQVSQVFEDAFNVDTSYVFTPVQRQLITDMKTSVDEMAKLMTEYGIPVNQTVLEGAGSSYFPRVLREIQGMNKEIANSRKAGLGSKPSSLKKRSYVGQAIEEAVRSGKVYESDPIAILEAFQSGAYKAIRDKVLQESISSQAVRTVPDSIAKLLKTRELSVRQLAQARKARDVVNRALRGERIPEGTLKSLQGPHADIVAAIRQAGRVQVQSTKPLVGANKRIADLLKVSRLGKAATQKRYAKVSEDPRAKAVAGEEIQELIDNPNLPKKKQAELRNEINKKLRQDLNKQERLRENAKAATSRGILVNARKGLRGIVEKQSGVLKEVRGKTVDARAAASRALEGEGKIMARGLDHPQFRGQFFDEETAAKIQKQLGLNEKTQFERAAEATGQVGDVMRVVRAGFDFGAPLLQGLPLLATNPGKWARGVKHQFEAFKEPLHHHKYLQENMQVIDEMLRYRIPLSGAATDYFDALKKGQSLEKWLGEGVSVKGITDPVSLGPGGRAAAKGVTAFQRSFDAVGDFSRIEQWKALRETAAARGEEGLDGLATYLRNSTGALSSAALGINPSQQSIERAFLFFSPRYTRSSLALVANAFQGGMQGEQARRAFRNMAMGGLGTYIFTASALGQEPKLDPTRGDFMTLKVGGSVVGVGSFWTSFVRLIGNTTDTATSTPEDLYALSSRDNPIVRWLRGRSSPTTGLAWDIATGNDFLGNDIERNVLEGDIDIATHALKQSAPFVLDSTIGFFAQAAQLENPASSGAVVGVEMFGGRTHPLSRSKQRDILRDERATAQFGKTWDELNRLQKAKINNDPMEVELASLTAGARADRVARGEEIDQEVSEYFASFDRGKEDWSNRIMDGYQDVVDGRIDLERFRKDVLSSANADRRAVFSSINEDPQYEPVREWIANLPNLPGASPEMPEDIAYDEYITEVIADPTLQRSDGLDYDARDIKIEAFRAKYGEEIYGYVRARLEEGRDVPPIVRELWRGQQQFDFYWKDVEDRVIESRPDAGEIGPLYKEWKKATDLRKEVLTENFPNLKNMIRTIGRVRSALREKDPALDIFLYRWGFTGTLKHPDNIFEGAGQDARNALVQDVYRLR